jgi:hypothetical protein
VATIVQSRLDDQTQQLMEELCVQLGMNPSQIIREGIRALAVTTPRAGKRRIIGQGEFASGITDLGSNKKHLEGFGR